MQEILEYLLSLLVTCATASARCRWWRDIAGSSSQCERFFAIPVYTHKITFAFCIVRHKIIKQLTINIISTYDEYSGNNNISTYDVFGKITINTRKRHS